MRRFVFEATAEAQDAIERTGGPGRAIPLLTERATRIDVALRVSAGREDREGS